MGENDNLEKIKCPACGAEMTKIYVPEAKIFVDVCIDSCGGIFFDKSEFEKFAVEKVSIEAIRSIMNGATFDYIDNSVI